MSCSLAYFSKKSLCSSEHRRVRSFANRLTIIHRVSIDLHTIKSFVRCATIILRLITISKRCIYLECVALAMFLVRDQKTKLENYNNIDSQTRADLTFKLLKKVSTFLDDISDMKHTLQIIPFQAQKKAFQENHIDLAFDLLEIILSRLDVAPVVGGNPVDPGDMNNRYVFKAFPVAAVDGKQGRYSTTRPATPEEIAANEHLQERIDRLKRFVTLPDGIPGPEFRPREYFDGLVEQAEKSGLKPIFEE